MVAAFPVVRAERRKLWEDPGGRPELKNRVKLSVETVSWEPVYTIQETRRPESSSE